MQASHVHTYKLNYRQAGIQPTNMHRRERAKSLVDLKYAVSSKFIDSIANNTDHGYLFDVIIYTQIFFDHM